MRHQRGPTERQQLLHGLEETGRALSAARSGFDAAWDADLTEYYLYAISALGARHSYLLRRLRALEEKEGL